MRKAMARAEVGDDVYGDDPTVNRLQELAAEMLGKEASLFLPTGTQSNLCALLAHCERGDEYIVGQHAHTYMYEGGGAAVFGSIQPQPLDFQPNGTIDLGQAARAIKPKGDPHFPVTTLLCLENTVGGRVLPMDYLADARGFVDRHGLGLHLDGARVFNAAVRLDVDVLDIATNFDSVSVCLSKGLGAPAGSVLCGSSELIGKAHRWRKMLGGAMRQAGIIAAAGIHALENNVERLAEDHANAAQLAAALAGIDGLHLDPDTVQTNIIFANVDPAVRQACIDGLESRGILVAGRDDWLRLVTHLDFRPEDVETVARAFHDVLSGLS